MSPTLKGNDLVNALLLHSKHVTDGFLTQMSKLVKSTNLTHFGFLKTRLGKFFPNGHSAFFQGVSSVVFMRPNEQVGRVDASPNVAPMADKFACRNWTKVDRPGDAMHCSKFALEEPITVSVLGVNRPIPEPAAFCLCDFVPKPSYAWKLARMAIVVDVRRYLARKTIDLLSAFVTFEQHLKTFLSDVKRGGSSRCCSAPLILPQTGCMATTF